MPIARRAAPACLLAFILAAPAGWAQSGSAPSGRSQPLEFTMRGELRNEYVDLQQGGGVNMIVPRLDYAVTPALSLRIETPFVTSGPEMGGANNETGFGDLLTRVSYRAMRGDSYAVVGGAEFIFDSASKDSLGYGREIIAPLAYASIDLPRYDSVLFPFVQLYVTVGGDSAREDVHYTSMKAPVLTRWPGSVYTVIEPHVVVDHEHADRLGLMLEAEVGRFVNRRLAVWGRPGVGLYGDALPQVYNWNLKAGLRYTF